ncbi:response regulator [Shewanella sp. WXL01]|uniref:Response regulator n=1 Tax=Shewanella maritima TaxID=2520507 RepID=A0A411PK91_9GAMM|nr:MULTISPECIES: response regulator [Shewanella]NKF50856.1 response regulator [Shewanella sp. WXL01]QBF83830.1 response regulator [Shewanella maritima]
MQDSKVLVIEDEQKIAQLLVDYLTLDGFDAEAIHEGTHAVETIKQMEPDMVILDLMLPGKDGISICKQVRAFSDVPILMLTARVDEIDRLIGLDSGADDYVCKPFLPKEVVARVKAILRRTKGREQLTQSDKSIEYRGIELTQESFKCVVNANEVELTPVEFRMLHTLVAKPGRVYSREQLMQASYKDERIVSDRTIDSHIKNIRKKLAPYIASDELIHSIYGVGYKID